MSTRTKHGEIVCYDLDTSLPVVEDRIWLRGHLSHDEARANAAAVLAEYELDGVPGAVKRVFARNIPHREHDGGWCVCVRECEPGRGAYAVTIVTVERAA